MLASSDPNTYGIAGSFKYTLTGSKYTGFHVGAGLGTGNHAEDKAFMRIAGIAGFHFKVAKRVLIHVDGGLTIINDDNTNNDEKNSQTVVAGHSENFGLSMMYIF